MRTIVLIGLMMAAGTLVAGTTLYRWVDDQGRVHYSDQPQPQAEEVEISEPVIFHRETTPGRQPAGRTLESSEAQPQDDPAPGYDRVDITAPKPDQILWNIGSILTVNVSLQPGLKSGHRIQVFYNGSEIADWPATATSYQIHNVYRGTHTVSAAVIDSAGKQIASGEAVTFHVKQTSIRN